MARYVQPSYTSGVQLKTNKFIVRPDELILAKNVYNDILGSWKTRLGSTKAGGTLQSGKDITGLFGDRTTGGKHLAVVNNSGDTNSILKWNNSGTWTAVSGATSLPADCNVNFASFLDQTYIFGKNDSNTFMTTASLSGTTYSQESSFPKAAYGGVFFDQLYLADCEVDGVRYANRIYYGSIPTYSSGWSFSFTPSTDYLQIDTDDGDYLTGVQKSYGQFLAFKNYSIHSIDLNQNVIQVDGTGCTSPRSIVSDDDKNVYFFHYSNKKKGVYCWDGTGAKKKSRAIDPIIDGCSGSGVIGGINNDHIYMYIGDVTLNSDVAEYFGLESMSNVLLDYSILDDLWTIHTLPVDITVMAHYNNVLYFGDNTGIVYQWNLGTSDNNSNIESIIVTHNFFGQFPAEYNKRKTFQNLIVNMHRTGRAEAFYSIDNGDWKPLGQLKDKVNDFSINGKGYGIKVKVTSNYGTFIFEGLEIEYSVEKTLRSK